MEKSPEEYTEGLTGVNDKYDTKPTLGSFCTDPDQFPNPEGMVVFSGFGMNAEDQQRGFIKPVLGQLPNYDLAAYKNRYSLPVITGEDESGAQDSLRDAEFRMKDVNTKGFLTRPRIPTER